MNPPVGVLTRNRAGLLNMTLRSLSATLPRAATVTVFDDASDDAVTRDYLYTSQTVKLQMTWPADFTWNSEHSDTPVEYEAAGLQDILPVVRLGEKPVGVFNASCLAMSRLAASADTHSGVILVQDDVLFAGGWYANMLDVAASPPGDVPAGLVAGCWLNFAKNMQAPATLIQRGPTAQCLFLTQAGLLAIGPWLAQYHGMTRSFDDHIAGAVRKEGLGVYCMYPAVCQHIGITSLVRPNRRWQWCSRRGRIDESGKGPFFVARTVHKFNPAQPPDESKQHNE